MSYVARLYAPPCVRWLVLVLGLVLAAPAQAEPADRGPLAPGDHVAELNGLKLWYRVSGAGPVCLLPNPPWGPSSDYLFRTLTPLEERFTVVYLDNRGCGRSEKAASTRAYTWDHLVADLEALRAHLGQEKVWLMGHSAGGWQVLHYAAAHPQRVDGLVLLGTSAWVDRADVAERMERRRGEPWFAEAEKAWEERSERPPPESDEQFQALIGRLFPPYWADPSRIAPHADHFFRRGRRRRRRCAGGATRAGTRSTCGPGSRRSGRRR